MDKTIQLIIAAINTDTDFLKPILILGDANHNVINFSKHTDIPEIEDEPPIVPFILFPESGNTIFYPGVLRKLQDVFEDKFQILFLRIY